MTDINETKIGSRIYEASFIFDNKIDETEALEKSNALKESIATLGGSFISEETPYLRGLAYEMIRVVNNVNVRFNEGYFGWIKFELNADAVKQIEKSLREDEQVVRYIVVKTVAENTVFTKRVPVVKAETLVNIVDVDTTIIPEIEILPEVVPELSVETTTGILPVGEGEITEVSSETVK